MSRLLSTFLSTELTCIPQFMDSVMGKCYNNAAGNALTWVFVMWTVLHFFFVQYLEELLRKMQFKTYCRKRLVHALWYSGFYGTGFLYCVATIIRNNMSFLELGKSIASDSGPIPPHVMLGLGLFGSFFWHSFVWELWTQGMKSSAFGYLVITLFPLLAYITRRIELYLSLLALVSLVQFIFNTIRILAVPTTKKSTGFSMMVYVSLGLYALVHMLIIPGLFIIPLVYNLVKNESSFALISLVIVMSVWWAVELYLSPLYKLANHWIHHTMEMNKRICPDNLIDCILFGPRDDIAFNLQVIRKEIKERQEILNAKRKPKNRGMLIQTLKCMVAIKRKLNKKRNSESSDSSSENEKAEKDSGSDEDSSSEDNSDVEDDAKREAKEYEEETARALMEDRESTSSQFEAETESKHSGDGAEEKIVRDSDGSIDVEHKKMD